MILSKLRTKFCKILIFFFCCKVEKTKQELKSRDVQSKRMEDTIHGLDLKIKDKDLKIKSLQDKVEMGALNDLDISRGCSFILLFSQ